MLSAIGLKINLEDNLNKEAWLELGHKHDKK